MATIPATAVGSIAESLTTLSGGALFVLGVLAFKMTPFEVHDVAHDSTSDYAPKDVIQSPRPREWVGEGDEHFKMIGTLFPTRIGGLNELQILQQQRQSGKPWPLIQGNGVLLGAFFIEHVSEHDTFLSLQGIGRVKEVEITLVRSPYYQTDAMQQVQQSLLAQAAAIPVPPLPPA